jgi:hypothetical protein
MPCHVPDSCHGSASPSAQFASINAEFGEVFDWQARVEDSIDVNEDAVRAAKEVARLLGERKGRSEFRNDFSDGREVYGFGIKQLLDELLVLF